MMHRCCGGVCLNFSTKKPAKKWFSQGFCSHRRENPRAPAIIFAKPSSRTHFFEFVIFEDSLLKGQKNERRSGQSHFGSERCHSPRTLEKCVFLKVLRFYTGGNGVWAIAIFEKVVKKIVSLQIHAFSIFRCLLRSLGDSHSKCTRHFCRVSPDTVFADEFACSIFLQLFSYTKIVDFHLVL